MLVQLNKCFESDGVTTKQNCFALTNAAGELEYVDTAAISSLLQLVEYALLAGRDGGQHLKGGIGAGENLTLSSTVDSQKGKVLLGSNSAYDENTTRLGIGTTNPTHAIHVEKSDGLFLKLAISATQYLTLVQNSLGYVTLDSFGTLPRFIFNDAVGIGASPIAKLQVGATTEQLRLGYDSSNYISVTVDSTGKATLNAVGTGAKFKFADRVNIPTHTLASATDTGETGDIAWDNDFFYTCVATNTWKRIPLATW